MVFFPDSIIYIVNLRWLSPTTSRFDVGIWLGLGPTPSRHFFSLFCPHADIMQTDLNHTQKGVYHRPDHLALFPDITFDSGSIVAKSNNQWLWHGSVDPAAPSRSFFSLSLSLLFQTTVTPTRPYRQSPPIVSISNSPPPLLFFFQS